MPHISLGLAMRGVFFFNSAFSIHHHGASVCDCANLESIDCTSIDRLTKVPYRIVASHLLSCAGKQLKQEQNNHMALRVLFLVFF